MLWYHFGITYSEKEIMQKNDNSNADNKTFMEGLLAFLNGLPGAVNTLLDTCADNVPVIGKAIKPAFWIMFAAMILQGMLWATGGDVLLESIWNGAMSFLPAGAAEAATQVAPNVAPSDVPVAPAT
jgi:hypothetical protein